MRSGSILFNNAISPKESPYLTLPIDFYPEIRHKSEIRNKSESLMVLLRELWGLEPPSSAIFVTGGADLSGLAAADLEAKEMLQSLLTRAIVRVAREKKAWVISGGTDTGVMRMLGESVRAYGGDCVAIGIAPLACLANAKEFRLSSGHEVTVRVPLQRGGLVAAEDPRDTPVRLERNHTHFLIVQSQSKDPEGEFGSESCFQNGFMEDVLSSQSGRSRGLLVLANGGVNSISMLERRLADKGDCVVIHGTGRAADDLYALHDFFVAGGRSTMSLKEMALSHARVLMSLDLYLTLEPDLRRKFIDLVSEKRAPISSELVRFADEIQDISGEAYPDLVAKVTMLDERLGILKRIHAVVINHSSQITWFSVRDTATDLREIVNSKISPPAAVPRSLSSAFTTAGTNFAGSNSHSPSSAHGAGTTTGSSAATSRRAVDNLPPPILNGEQPAYMSQMQHLMDQTKRERMRTEREEAEREQKEPTQQPLDEQRSTPASPQRPVFFRASATTTGNFNVTNNNFGSAGSSYHRFNSNSNNNNINNNNFNSSSSNSAPYSPAHHPFAGPTIPLHLPVPHPFIETKLGGKDAFSSVVVGRIARADKSSVYVYPKSCSESNPVVANPADVAQYFLEALFDATGFKVPRSMVVVTGSARVLDKEPKTMARVVKLLEEGFFPAVIDNAAWVLTGGTDSGIMKAVGQAYSAVVGDEQRDPLRVPDSIVSRKADHAYRTFLLGTPPDTAVIGRDALERGGGISVEYPPPRPAAEVARAGVMAGRDDTYELNKDHDFFFISRSTEQKYGESANDGWDKVLKRFLSDIVPTVLVIFGGGQNSLPTVVQYVRQRNPIVVIEGMGPGNVADVIAQAWRAKKDGRAFDFKTQHLNFNVAPLDFPLVCLQFTEIIEDGFSLIDLASLDEPPAALDRIIKKHVKPGIDERLHRACGYPASSQVTPRPRMAELLILQTGASTINVKINDETPLTVAVHRIDSGGSGKVKQSINLVELLLKKGADMNMLSHSQRTSLLDIAMMRGSKALANKIMCGSLLAAAGQGTRAATATSVNLAKGAGAYAHPAPTAAASPGGSLAGPRLSGAGAGVAGAAGGRGGGAATAPCPSFLDPSTVASAQRESAGIILEMLRLGVTLEEARNDLNETALTLACRAMNVPAAIVLLQKGASIERRDPVAMDACRYMLHAAAFLIQPFECYRCQAAGTVPELERATSDQNRQCVEVIQRLLVAGVTAGSYVVSFRKGSLDLFSSRFSVEVLREAIIHGDEKLVEYLVDLSFQRSDDGEPGPPDDYIQPESLCVAVRLNRTAIAKQLMRCPSVRGKPGPILEAIRLGNIEIVQEFLTHFGPDDGLISPEMLEVAVTSSNIDIAVMLLQRCPKVSCKLFSPMSDIASLRCMCFSCTFDHNLACDTCLQRDAPPPSTSSLSSPSPALPSRPAQSSTSGVASASTRPPSSLQLAPSATSPAAPMALNFAGAASLAVANFRAASHVTASSPSSTPSPPSSGPRASSPSVVALAAHASPLAAPAPPPPPPSQDSLMRWALKEGGDDGTKFLCNEFVRTVVENTFRKELLGTFRKRFFHHLAVLGVLLCLVWLYQTFNVHEFTAATRRIFVEGETGEADGLPSFKFEDISSAPELSVWFGTSLIPNVLTYPNAAMASTLAEVAPLPRILMVGSARVQVDLSSPLAPCGAACEDSDDSFPVRTGSGGAGHDADLSGATMGSGPTSKIFHVTPGENVEQVLSRVRRWRGWMDDRTSAVRIDFTLYSTKLDRFCSATFTFLFSDAGGVDPSARFQSWKLHSLATWMDCKFSWLLEVVLLFLTSWLIYQEAKELHTAGLVLYRQNLWNWFDGFSCLMLLVYLIHRSRILLAWGGETFTTGELLRAVEFVDLGGHARHILIDRWLLAGAFCATGINTLKHLRVIHRETGKLLLVCKDMFKNLEQFGLLFLCVLVTVGVCSNLVFGMDIARFRSPLVSVLSVIRIIFGDAEFGEFADQHIHNQWTRWFGSIFTTGVIVVFTVMLLNLLVAMLNQSYSDVQERAENAIVRQRTDLVLTTLQEEFGQRHTFHVDPVNMVLKVNKKKVQKER